MKPTIRRRAAAFLVLFACAWVGAGVVQADTDADVSAARRAARAAFDASGRTAPSIVVDGTPRPSPGAPVGVETPPRSRGERPPSGPHDRTVNSLTTVIGEAGMAVPLGGDDVEIARSMDFSGSAFIQIASDGRYFVGVAENGGVQIYLSSDKGESWSLWSTLVVPGDHILWLSNMVLAEGLVDRLMIAYGGYVSHEVRLAYADPGAAVPSWTIVTILSDAGIVHGTSNRVDLATDDDGFSDYFVYVVAESEDADGNDVWFARSVDQGTSFEPGYRIADSSVGSDDGYFSPTVSVGAGNYVHVAYTSDDATPVPSTNARHRRASNFASSGLASWSPENTVRAQGASDYSNPISVGSSFSDPNVYVTLLTVGGPDLMRFSTDSGATWPAANVVTSNYPIGTGMAPMLVPGGGLIVGGLDVLLDSLLTVDIVMSRSSVADPTSWTVPQSFSHNLFAGGPTYGRLESMEPDPDFGNRIATVFVQTLAPQKILRFDAEWRRDPGYPNTDIGFPMVISGGGTGTSPPAVVEIDGDSEFEIVFATTSGDIHVINHDGSAVAGWPVNIGSSIPYDAPVVVGDLVGNGTPSIVVGSTDGAVFAFDPGGTIVPGWPVFMTEADDVYLAIGALGPPNPRYVVAVCGHEMRAIRHDGVDVSPAWGTFVDVFAAGPAIGDVDNDGVAEIVTLKGHWLHVHSLAAGVNEAFRNFPSDEFRVAPSLADIDGDGDLEVAAPTVAGKLYLLQHTGADYPGWPVTINPGISLTSVAFGQILGTAQPELVFAEATGDVHVRYHTGVEQTGYPVSSGSSVIYTSPMLSPVSIVNSNVNIGTTAGGQGVGQSWRNIVSIPTPGWPKNLPGPVEETFASGDIDLDGRNELVVLGVDFVTVLDVGTGPATVAANHWPMYGYDPQRTQCLDCGEILTGAGDAPVAARSAGLDVHPNPFNPVTTIEYDVAVAGNVSLEIFDVAGKRVATLIDNERRAVGRHSLTYAPGGASGVYFARLRTPGGEVTRKIVLLK